MKKWLIVHDLVAYKQHPDMIGKSSRLASQKFEEIKKGDQIVYYARKDMVVTGIFEVISERTQVENDPYWNDYPYGKSMTIYKIKPVAMPLKGYYLDFKKLVMDPSVRLDTFPRESRWGGYIQGRTCISLTDRDLLTIRNALSNMNYLKSM